MKEHIGRSDVFYKMVAGEPTTRETLAHEAPHMVDAVDHMVDKGTLGSSDQLRPDGIMERVIFGRPIIEKRK